VEDGPDELGPSVGGRREEMRMTSGTITLKRNESERGDMLAAKPAISIFFIMGIEGITSSSKIDWSVIIVRRERTRRHERES